MWAKLFELSFIRKKTFPSKVLKPKIILTANQSAQCPEWPHISVAWELTALCMHIHTPRHGYLIKLAVAISKCQQENEQQVLVWHF